MDDEVKKLKAVRDIQLPGTVTELSARLTDMDMAHLTRVSLALVALTVYDVFYGWGYMFFFELIYRGGMRGDNGPSTGEGLHTSPRMVEERLNAV